LLGVQARKLLREFGQISEVVKKRVSEKPHI